MNDAKQIKTALISVFNKEGLDKMLKLLSDNGVKFLSTGGTHDFIVSLGYECGLVEDLTGYPSILGGRVKTLHPSVFGGILARRDNVTDTQQREKYNIPEIDLVVVDLYPFENTVSSGASHSEIIEKIDIGGISLIRAAAKNFKDVVIVASKEQYQPLVDILEAQGAVTSIEQRRSFACSAFAVSSGYDSAIFNWFAAGTEENTPWLRIAENGRRALRYGENPHQQGAFYGDFDSMFAQLHGKEISYNNILDINAVCGLVGEFDEPTFAIVKHSNACGIATADNICEAWQRALACDPVSAFGGVLCANREIDKETAEKINEIFLEVIIAPKYSDEALEILKQKKNRIVLVQKKPLNTHQQYRSAIGGILCQDVDSFVETAENLNVVTTRRPSEAQIADMLFAIKVVKHSKSNAIVLAKDGRLLASGIGQTSRVDSLKQAIEKANSFGFDLHGATMASDAFFPFADCVEIAHQAGIVSVVHPGGSKRDQDSIDYCEQNDMTMAMTGIRHFRH